MTSSKSLEGRLELVEAKLQIHELINRFGHNLDLLIKRKDEEALRKLFQLNCQDVDVDHPLGHSTNLDEMVGLVKILDPFYQSMYRSYSF